MSARKALLTILLLLAFGPAVAAIDSADKRASASAQILPEIFPLPDSGITDADRAHLAGLYRGFVIPVSLGDPAPDATLDYDFVEDNSLQARIGPTLTYARTGEQSCYDSSGVMVFIAENVPCFDYDPATLQALGLSIWEGRTNLLTYSEQVDNAAWTKLGLTIDADATQAPTNALTMDRMNVLASNERHRIYQQVTSSANTNYVVSAFVEDDGARYVGINWLGATNDWITAVYDLQSGTVTQESEGATTGTIQDAEIRDIGGGIYRIFLSGEVATANAFVIIAAFSSDTPTLDTSGNETFLGVAGEDFFIYGIDTQVGDELTPYIRTTTTTASRGDADVQVNDVSFLDAAATAEGTVYVQAAWDYTPSGGGIIRRFIHIDDNTNNNRISMNLTGTNLTKFQFKNSVGDFGDADTVAPQDAGKIYGMAGSYKLDNLNFAIDGVLVDKDTTVTTPMPVSLSWLRLGKSGNDNQYANGYIKRARYYPFWQTLTDNKYLSKTGRMRPANDRPMAIEITIGP